MTDCEDSQWHTLLQLISLWGSLVQFKQSVMKGDLAPIDLQGTLDAVPDYSSTAKATGSMWWA